MAVVAFLAWAAYAFPTFLLVLFCALLGALTAHHFWVLAASNWLVTSLVIIKKEESANNRCW